MTFHYLPSNPVTCEVQNEFLAQYPNVLESMMLIIAASTDAFLERPSQALDGYMLIRQILERAVYYYALDDFSLRPSRSP